MKAVDNMTREQLIDELKKARREINNTRFQNVENEERFHIASKITGDVVYERDIQTGIATFYGDIDSHLGYEPGGYPRTMEGWREHVHPEDLAWIDALSLSSLKPGIPYSIEYRMRKRDGTYMIWLDRIEMIVKDGKPVKFIGAAADITEHKRAEETLRKSEERFRNIVENAAAWVWEVDASGKYTYASDACEKILGYKPEEVLGKYFYDLFPCDEQEKYKEAAFETFANKQTFHEFINPNVHRNGETVWLSTSGVPIQDERGTLMGYRGADTNVTERKQAEENLRESKERFQALVESTDDFIWEIDVNGVYTYCSPKAKELWGYTPENLVGKTPLELMIPEDRERFVKEIWKISESRSPFKGIESSSYDSNGRVVIVETSGVPFYDNSGRLLGFRGTSRDITEQKRAENALRESEERYRALLDTGGDAGIGIIVVQDINGREAVIVFINKQLSNMLGYTPEELLGESGFRFLHLENLDTIKRRYRERLTGKDVINCYEAVGVDKEGTQIPVEVSIGIMTYGGKPATVAYVKDITERKQAEEALRQSKELFSRAFHSSPDILTILNLETGKYVEVNDSFITTTGYTREELIGHTRDEVNIWANREDEEKLGELFAESNKIRNEEFHIHTKSGDIRTWLCSADIIDIEGAKCMLGVAADITERRRAEEALKESEERFRLIAENSPYYIFQLDKNGKITYSSSAIHKILGYTPEERKGKAYTDLITPSDIPRAMKEFEEVTISKLPRDFEIDAVHKSGRTITVAGSIVPFYINGEPVSYYGIMRDVSELKNAERVLRESEDKLRNMFERANDGIALLDLDGRCIEVNDSASKILGVDTKEELIGRSAFDFITPEDRDRANQNFQELLERGNFPITQYSAIREDGAIIPIELNAGILTDTWRKPNSVVVTFRDISERNALEEERQRGAKLESIGTLAGGIAHDFNNYLASIIGNISLARKYIDSDSVAGSHLLEAEEAVIQARDLTQQLLTFARGGSPVKKTIFIGDLIEDTTRFALRGSNVKPEFSIPDDLWPAEVDASQVRQVISNLVINAVEAMREGGFIQVKTENYTIDGKGIIPLPKGKYLKLTFTDHGTGIPQEYIKRVFDPYFTTKGSGSGLGLATVYSIVRAHGGHIEVESKVDSGTTFTIFLPASKKAVPRPKPKRKLQKLPILKSSRLLVMDDNEQVRKMLAKILGDMVEAVALAADGDEAIKQYVEARESGHPFDVVIMDLTIPGGIGGREAIKQLLEIDPHAKVIVSSGYSDHRIMSEYKKYGFSGVLGKPYNVDELRSTIEGILRRRKKAQPATSQS